MTESREPATGSPSDAVGDAPGPGAAPATTSGEAPRLALRSPVEVLLWIFLTRLVALVMPTRSGGPAATTDSTDTSASTGPGTPADPNRAGRVAASRPGPGAPAAADPSGRTHGDATAGRRDASSTRAIAVTTATALAAGAAAFAAGRRRGAR